jgi:hypothetical protein
VAALLAAQRVRDTPGKVLHNIEENAPATVPKAKSGAAPKAKSKSKPKAAPDAPLKDGPDPVKPADSGSNTKKQIVADAAAAADKARITQLSKEANAALKKGDKTLAKAKIDEAREILNPYLPKNPGDSWDEVVKRLDVSSPRDGAVFWSGDPKAAQRYAESINGVTLETTAGGRIIDTTDKEFEWEEMKRYAWDYTSGDGPYGRDLWGAASGKYAEGASGTVYAVQTPTKLEDTKTLWHNVEKPVLLDKVKTREISGINLFSITGSGDLVPLNKNRVDALNRLKGTAPL